MIYLQHRASDRLWEQPSPAHDHVVWEDGQAGETTAERWIDDADLVVFSWYASSAARRLIRQRTASGRPWCYWGERPGFGHSGLLGRLWRHWGLASLHRSRAPIWGMGSWAVAAWRREFGERRDYHNVPYFSDLRRFQPPADRCRPPGIRRFLFSGSLIPRKGADLLAEAFARIAGEFPAARLDLVGTGELEPALRARLACCGERVRFLGFRHWPELPALYCAADILCAPSLYDGWGLMVPEGLAAGLPVIATDRMGAALDLIQQAGTAGAFRLAA